MKQILCLSYLAVALTVSTACLADSISYSNTLVTSSNSNLGGVAGFTFTANLVTYTDNNNFNLDFSVQDTSGYNGALNDFTLSLLGGGNSLIDVTSSVFPSIGWSELDNAKINNGSTGCTAGNGSGGWLCASGTSALNVLAGNTYHFYFSGTYQGTVTSPFDLMANGSISYPSGDTKVGVSSYMTQTSVPEPSAMLLLGSGLSGAALLRCRKAKKQSID